MGLIWFLVISSLKLLWTVKICRSAQCLAEIILEYRMLTNLYEFVQCQCQLIKTWWNLLGRQPHNTRYTQHSWHMIEFKQMKCSNLLKTWNYLKLLNTLFNILSCVYIFIMAAQTVVFFIMFARIFSFQNSNEKFKSKSF